MRKKSNYLKKIGKNLKCKNKRLELHKTSKFINVYKNLVPWEGNIWADKWHNLFSFYGLSMKLHSVNERQISGRTVCIKTEGREVNQGSQRKKLKIGFKILGKRNYIFIKKFGSAMTLDLLDMSETLVIFGTLSMKMKMNITSLDGYWNINTGFVRALNAAGRRIWCEQIYYK